MLEFGIFIFGMAAVLLLSYTFIPTLAIFFKKLQERKVRRTSEKLEEMFIVIKQSKISLFQFLSPLVLGLMGFILFQNILLALIAGIFGLGLPNLFLKNLERRRRIQFHHQLVDGLTILSSSLKAGLSLFQAIEVLIEEMPSPISQEFGLILKQNKMGVTLEECLEQLNKRMPSDELNLITTAILIARETGGELTEVLERLISTIRQKQKIADQIKTLTTQGRWQGIIMSILPIAFAGFIYQMNPKFFELMLGSQVGRGLLIYAVISELVGVYLIRKLSRVEV